MWSARQLGERLGLLFLAPAVLVGGLEALLWAFDVAPVEETLSAVEYPFAEGAILHRLSQPGPAVICLGDSSMAGYPLDRGPDAARGGFSMCDRVAAALGIRAVNLAEGGLAMRHVAERAAVACRVPPPRGSLVLLYGGHNEFLNLPRLLRTPGSTGGLVRTLEHLRLFRLLRRWLGHRADAAESLSDVGEPITDRETVMAEFERSVRAITAACQSSPLVIATVIGNPAFHVPNLPSHDDGLSDDAETPRQYARRRRRDGPSDVGSSTREMLIAPDAVDTIIARVAHETATPLFDARAVATPDPLAAFLDWVHPTGQLHDQLAAGFLAAAVAAGLVPAAPPIPPSTVSPERLAWASEKCALDNLKIDPSFALSQLAWITAPQDPLSVAVAQTVGAFILDRPDALASGFAALEEVAPATIARCLAGHTQTGEPLRCLPWRAQVLLSTVELRELVAEAPATPAVRRLLESF